MGIEHFCLFKLKFGCDAILFLLVSKTLRVLDVVVQLTSAVCGTRAAKKSIKVLRSYSIRSQLIFSDFAYQLRFELNDAVKRKSLLSAEFQKLFFLRLICSCVFVKTIKTKEHKSHKYANFCLTACLSYANMLDLEDIALYF